MRIAWLFCAAVIGLFLGAGCQPTYWYQEGRTFDECKADHKECRTELEARTDRNHMSDYERRFMVDCMQQRGYRLVADRDLPLDVKREEPNVVSAVPWNRFYGIAGRRPNESERKRIGVTENLRVAKHPSL